MKRGRFKWKSATKTWCNILCSIKLWLHWIVPVEWAFVATRKFLVLLKFSLLFLLQLSEFTLWFALHTLHSICCSKIYYKRWGCIHAHGEAAPTITTHSSEELLGTWINQMRISYSFFGLKRYEWVCMCVYAYTFLTIKLPHCQCIYFMLLPLAFWSRNKKFWPCCCWPVACARNKPAIKRCSAVFQMRV